MKRLLVILLSSIFASHGVARVAKAEAPLSDATIGGLRPLATSVSAFAPSNASLPVFQNSMPP
jgi:hypothetical protein